MKSRNGKDHLFVDISTEPAANVELQPRVRVYRWRTFRNNGEFVLVCELPDTGRIRVTTPIAHWDTNSGQVITDSGRAYELIGSEAEKAVDFAMALVCMGLEEWL